MRCAEEGGGGQAIAAAGKEVEGLKKKVEEARLAVKKLEHAITRSEREA